MDVLGFPVCSTLWSFAKAKEWSGKCCFPGFAGLSVNAASKDLQITPAVDGSKRQLIIGVWVKQCHVYHPWLEMVTIAPIKKNIFMVMTGGWFIVLIHIIPFWSILVGQGSHLLGADMIVLDLKKSGVWSLLIDHIMLLILKLHNCSLFAERYLMQCACVSTSIDYWLSGKVLWDLLCDVWQQGQFEICDVASCQISSLHKITISSFLSLP